MPVHQEVEVKKLSKTNFTAVHVGPFSQLNTYKLEMPTRKVEGKLFLKELLGFTGMQISMNKLPAGVSVPFYHQHKQNEEAYLFVKGKGQMQVDGETFDVEEGSVVRIAPHGSRVLRNNSNEDLHFIVIQAQEGSLKQETFEDGIPSSSPVAWPN